MAVTPNSAIYPQTPRLIGVGISTTTAPLTQSTFFAGAASGTKVTGLWVCNGDSGLAHGFGIYTQSSAVITSNITISLPGNNLGIPINLLSTAIWPGLPIDADGNPFLILASTSETLVAVYATALSAGTQIVVGGVAADLAVTPNQIVTPQTPRLAGASISTGVVPANTPVAVVTGGANGTKVMGLFISSQDPVDRSITVEIVHGGVFGSFMFTTIPALSGSVSPTIPPVNLLSPAIWPGLPLDSDGNPYFLLGSSLDFLQMLYSGLSSGTSFFMCAVAADF